MRAKQLYLVEIVAKYTEHTTWYTCTTENTRKKNIVWWKQNVVYFSLVFPIQCKQNSVRNEKNRGEWMKKKWYIDFCSLWQYNIFGWTFAILLWCEGFGTAVSFRPMTIHWKSAPIGKLDFTTDNIRIIHICLLIWQTISFFHRCVNCWCTYTNNYSNGTEKNIVISILMYVWDVLCSVLPSSFPSISSQTKPYGIFLYFYM